MKRHKESRMATNHPAQRASITQGEIPIGLFLLLSIWLISVSIHSFIEPDLDLLRRYVMPAGTGLSVKKRKLLTQFGRHDITSFPFEQYSTDSEGKERKEVTESGFG